MHNLNVENCDMHWLTDSLPSAISKSRRSAWWLAYGKSWSLRTKLPHPFSSEMSPRVNLWAVSEDRAPRCLLQSPNVFLQDTAKLKPRRYSENDNSNLVACTHLFAFDNLCNKIGWWPFAPYTKDNRTMALWADGLPCKRYPTQWDILQEKLKLNDSREHGYWRNWRMDGMLKSRDLLLPSLEALLFFVLTLWLLVVRG
jgi:hypothetical protein